MARAAFRASALDAAPLTSTVMNLLAPSPSRTTWVARSVSSSLSTPRKALSSGAVADWGLRFAARPVAASRTVSLVEVSLSTVIQLKEVRIPSLSNVRNTDAGNFASVNTNANIVAISGAIMPDPLAMPQRLTSVSPIRVRRIAPLG